MAGNLVFNITICILGMMIFLIHIVNFLMKKNRRKDENVLLIFFAFTFVHFATYLTFTLVKEVYTSNAFIIAFYTTFYIMNNLEVFLLFYYLLNYASVPEKQRKIVSIINVSVFGVLIVLDIINVFTRMFFTAVDGVYTRAPMMFFAQIYQFVAFALIFIVALVNKKLIAKEKIAFFLYCLLPLVAIVVQNLLPGYAIAYMSIIVTTEILVLFLDVAKNIRIQEAEKEVKEAYIKIMVSQIRPHFVYNTLSSISTLISLDPKKAKKALDDFTDYLRMNFSTLTNNELVRFEDELKHIETYVSLEKMRFSDRLNVIYDIKVKDFEVPPLSIQPLVENAIKHGILKKIEGGTLWIKTYEEDDMNIVEIIDDGVGFNMDDVDFIHNEHIGLNNIKHRLHTMCSASMIIDSKPGKGTRVAVTFSK